MTRFAAFSFMGGLLLCQGNGHKVAAFSSHGWFAFMSGECQSTKCQCFIFYSLELCSIDS